MNTIRLLAASFVVLAVLLGSTLAGDAPIKSGPQVKEKVPGPFHPLNVTGEFAGKKNCLFCSNGDNPVAMVFARQPSDALTTLIKKIDTATAKNSGCSMGSFVVFLNDSEGLEKQLKAVAEKENIKHCVLSIDNPAGPKGYNVNKDADVTVVLYTERVVRANYAFKAGQMKEGDINKIVGDISKILPQK
ncbi:MAG: hypothetical protein L0312_17940 [Acidobacteria bacterium]|nr:hypothetical protein [Acidobacteriota bacterium]